MEKIRPSARKRNGADLCGIYGVYHYEVKIGLGKHTVKCYNHIDENKRIVRIVLSFY